VEHLLATKFFVPSNRPELVQRPRLIDQLNHDLHRKLTLISAPAGFGKTTLVSEWVDKLLKEDKKEHRIAWLSLDEGDNDLTRFLIYFVTALKRTQGKKTTIGDEALSLLRSPQPPPTETIMTSLVNEIAGSSGKIVFILDDYHLIEAQSIHDALGFLLENLPPQLHMLIATREDPLLPLSRLRARGQLTELRAANLRFTTSEANEFLNQVMGLELSTVDIAALERRTEGWIAGLQLAAISLQGKKDTSQLIKSFSGSYRFVLDYLIEEVLEQQTQSIQTFLLQTSILNRLTGSLCNAVTGQDNGKQILESLDRANLFIVPLDEKRHWYRYHHLFADLLRQRLDQKHPEQISKLHQLASVWYQQRSLWSDALHHAFAVEDNERAADLIELAWVPMNTSYQSVTWLGWAKTLPEDLVRSRPVLTTACGWASLDTGDLEAAKFHFRDADRLLDVTKSKNAQLENQTDDTRAAKSRVSSGKRNRNILVLDKEGLRTLAISIANGHAYLAQALDDMDGTVEYAQRAIDLLREDEYFERGLSDIILGFAFWARGDLGSAYVAVSDAISNMQSDGKIQFIISFTSYLADIMTAQGCLHETEETYLRSLETVTGQNEIEVRETAVLHLGLSELYFEQGDMEAAMRHLQRSEELGKHPAFPPWYRHWIWARASVRRALGNLDGVAAMLTDAERLYYRHPIPDVRPLKALIARTWLAQGKLTEAIHWVLEQGLSVGDDLSYLREFEHITLARVLIAQYRSGREKNYIKDAKKLLERLLKAAEDGKRMGSVIEILALQALTSEAQDSIPEALKSLERAITLAEPEGYFRIFVDEGPPMAHLLYEALSRKINSDYVQRLLAAFPVEEPRKSDSPHPQRPDSALIEPLSEREIEILHLIADGQSNQKIGAKLFLSLNTVKAHTRNIYGKLGVNSRTQAAARARALGILSDS